jgi:hypothetical protein
VTLPFEIKVSKLVGQQKATIPCGINRKKKRDGPAFGPFREKADTVSVRPSLEILHDNPSEVFFTSFVKNKIFKIRSTTRSLKSFFSKIFSDHSSVQNAHNDVLLVIMYNIHNTYVCIVLYCMYTMYMSSFNVVINIQFACALVYRITSRVIQWLGR